MAQTEILQQIVDAVHARHAPNCQGEVADYIPALASVEPDRFGISITTITNETISSGDVDTEFSIQSASKPFLFGLAMDELGEDVLFERVGVEPSGEAFNTIELEPERRIPFNPMINAGAIGVTGALYDALGVGTDARILEMYGKLAGGAVPIDEEVFQSELITGARNRALAYLMHSTGALDPPIEEKLKSYFRQCSARVTARKLSLMAATLANIGRSPATGETVFTALTVRRVLAVMFTCGMYDFAGRWAVDVGLPAKSGVSGCVMAVVNRQIGIGIYSPRLDAHGNSVRAIAACRDLAEELGLHAFELSNSGSSILGSLLD